MGAALLCPFLFMLTFSSIFSFPSHERACSHVCLVVSRGEVRTGLGRKRSVAGDKRQAPASACGSPSHSQLTGAVRGGRPESKESMEVGRSKTMCSKKAVTRLQERGQLSGCQREK